jgi:hypothetical protein
MPRQHPWKLLLGAFHEPCPALQLLSILLAMERLRAVTNKPTPSDRNKCRQFRDQSHLNETENLQRQARAEK